MNKKTSKVLITTFTVVLFLVVVLYVGIGAFGSISLLSGACAGGFKSNLVETNREDIFFASDSSVGDEQFAQIRRNMKWDGRTVQAEYYNGIGEKFVLTGELKWFWNEKFEWNITET